MGGAEVSDVIVVGGGVIGLTTALVLAERGHRVRVWSREPASATASAVAGALWWPYRIEPAESAGDWSLTSLRRYEELARRSEETGVRLVAGLHRGERLAALGPWAGQLKDLVQVADGLRARLPLIDMPVYLGWLERRLAAAGVAVEQRAVTTFDGAAAEAGAVTAAAAPPPAAVATAAAAPPAEAA
ncbi:FAD-dependent oxidoreductase, partial [Streptomyces sp. NPDC059744]|uniref:FAD-dependent oxidoreductase n=1 Tax=Streptomyces sp. NPDC059744 TaxID=3346929 RepID=UPI0036587909